MHDWKPLDPNGLGSKAYTKTSPRLMPAIRSQSTCQGRWSGQATSSSFMPWEVRVVMILSGFQSPMQSALQMSLERPCMERLWLERLLWLHQPGQVQRPLLERPWLERPWLERPWLERQWLERPWLEHPTCSSSSRRPLGPSPPPLQAAAGCCGLLETAAALGWAPARSAAGASVGGQQLLLGCACACLMCAQTMRNDNVRGQCTS